MPLSKAKGNPEQGKGYDSVEEMITDIRKMANSKDKGESMHGKELLKMIYTKFAKGNKQPIHYEDTEGIRGFIKKQNEAYREKFLQGENIE